MKVPLIGYCDICGETTLVNNSPNGISNSDVSSDNRMEVYELDTGSGTSVRRLCYMHYWQEKRNNDPVNATLRESYWEKLQGSFQALFPQQRHTNNK